MGTLNRRNGAATGVPESKDLDGIRHDTVVEMVVDAAEMNTPDAKESRVARKRTNTRLTPDERKGLLDLVSDGSRRRNSIELPPNRGFVDLRGSAARDTDRKQLTQARLRSRARRLSPETASPRCISSIARSSALSNSGEASNDSSSSRARTVTVAPSSKSAPSRTIFPPTTFPVATFISEMLLRPRDNVE